MTEVNAQPLGPPPARRAGSLRRTSSTQSHAFTSMTMPFAMLGRARDLYTADERSAPQTLAEETLHADISATREIVSIAASRRLDALDALRSLRLGGPLRKAMLNVIPAEVERSSLLHRLLDDTVGASIVRDAALEAWGIGDGTKIPASPADSFDITGSCITFQRGARTVLPSGQPNTELVPRISAYAPPKSDDRYAWHEWPQLEGPNQLRLRRTDLWQEEGLLCVDAAFQDSAGFPEKEQRLVFHEYRVQAAIEPASFVLQSVEVESGVLPFTECLQSAATAQQMVGQSLQDFRRSVPARLPGIAGCTHLNDVLRSLQDVVTMSEMIEL